MPVTLSPPLRLRLFTKPRSITSAGPSALVAGGSRRTFCPSRTSPLPLLLPLIAETPRAARDTAVSCTSAGICRRTMATNGDNHAPDGLRLRKPVIFVCDVQERFREAIHEFDRMVMTIEKLLKFAQKLPMPIYATTQNAIRLGHTVPKLAAYLPANVWDKTRFSMLDANGNTPGFNLQPASAVALVGIESHICITQTALDLRNAGHMVYVIADGVSSCNQAEVVVALDRLRAEQGIRVTSSESWMYEVVGDANHPAFKTLFQVVKGSMADTKKVLEALPVGAKI